jgi:hypothetical protein
VSFVTPFLTPKFIEYTGIELKIIISKKPKTIDMTEFSLYFRLFNIRIYKTQNPVGQPVRVQIPPSAPARKPLTHQREPGFYLLFLIFYVNHKITLGTIWAPFLFLKKHYVYILAPSQINLKLKKETK